jgi:hypothetical protein
MAIHNKKRFQEKAPSNISWSLSIARHGVSVLQKARTLLNFIADFGEAVSVILAIRMWASD